LIVRIGFGDLYAGLNRVQGPTSGVEDFPGFGIGSLAEIPGGDDEGGGGLIRSAPGKSRDFLGQRGGQCGTLQGNGDGHGRKGYEFATIQHDHVVV
jgi:hypothetical protein